MKSKFKIKKVHKITAIALAIAVIFTTGCASGQKKNYRIDSLDATMTIDTLYSISRIEANNSSIELDMPDGYSEQKQYFDSMIGMLEEKENFSLVNDVNLFSMLYIDQILEGGKHIQLVDKLKKYQYSDGIMSIYPNDGKSACPKSDIVINCINMCYGLRKAGEGLSNQELVGLGILDTLKKVYADSIDENWYKTADETEKNYIRCMYTEMILMAHVRDLVSEFDFSSIQTIQRMLGLSDAEKLVAEVSIENAGDLKQMSIEAMVYDKDDTLEHYASDMFAGLNSYSDISGGFIEWAGLVSYLELGGAVSGNRYYAENINQWLDDSFDNMTRPYREN